MSTSGKNTKSESSGGFFQNLFASLFKSSNPEADKKRKLKNIAKAFAKTKFHMFYKPNTLEVTSAFAKMMYDFYKATSQAQVYFRNSPNPNQNKQRLITYSLSENQIPSHKNRNATIQKEIPSKASCCKLFHSIFSRIQIVLHSIIET